jgi:hypothetical protein
VEAFGEFWPLDGGDGNFMNFGFDAEVEIM